MQAWNEASQKKPLCDTIRIPQYEFSSKWLHIKAANRFVTISRIFTLVPLRGGLLQKNATKTLLFLSEGCYWICFMNTILGWWFAITRVFMFEGIYKNYIIISAMVSFRIMHYRFQPTATAFLFTLFKGIHRLTNHPAYLYIMEQLLTSYSFLHNESGTVYRVGYLNPIYFKYLKDWKFTNKVKPYKKKMIDWLNFKNFILS